MSNQQVNFDELFGEQKPKEKQKEANFDMFSSLFSVQAAHQQQKKKEKPKDDVHQFIKMAQQSTAKAKDSVKKMIQQKTMTANQIKHKREIEKVTAKFNKVAKESNGQTKKYMPTIVDPFGTAKRDQNSSGNASKQNKKVDRDDTKEERKGIKNQDLRKKIEQKERMQIQKEKQRQRRKKAQARRARQQVQKNKKQQETRRQKIIKQHKRNKSSSSSSDSSSGSGSIPQQQNFDWRKQIRALMGVDPTDKKYRQRDRMVIRQSGFDQIVNQDRFSRRMGRLEQQQDLRRQLAAQKKHQKHRQN